MLVWYLTTHSLDVKQQILCVFKLIYVPKKFFKFFVAYPFSVRCHAMGAFIPPRVPFLAQFQPSGKQFQISVICPFVYLRYLQQYLQWIFPTQFFYCFCRFNRIYWFFFKYSINACFSKASSAYIIFSRVSVSSCTLPFGFSFDAVSSHLVSIGAIVSD